MLEILQDKIERGIYPVGGRLPGERTLAAEYGVPQSRIHRKLQELVAAGYLTCQRGSGYFVRAGRPHDRKFHRVAFCWESRSSDESAGPDFYTEMLFNCAADFKLNLTVFKLPRDKEEQNRLFMQLINEEYKGIIAYPHFISELLPAFITLRQAEIPLLFWDFSPLPAIFPAVGIDHFSSCFNAARVIGVQNMPVTFIGFGGSYQSQLKLAGFEAGCTACGVKLERRIIIPYDQHFSGDFGPELAALEPGKLYFTSTRILTGRLLGSMLDRGCLPGRDYYLLGTDQLEFIKGSSLQLDCIMRDRTGMVRMLLHQMQQAIETKENPCNDLRIAMRYIPGGTLKRHPALKSRNQESR